MEFQIELRSKALPGCSYLCRQRNAYIWTCSEILMKLSGLMFIDHCWVQELWSFPISNMGNFSKIHHSSMFSKVFYKTKFKLKLRERPSILYLEFWNFLAPPRLQYTISFNIFGRKIQSFREAHNFWTTPNTFYKIEANLFSCFSWIFWQLVNCFCCWFLLLVLNMRKVKCLFFLLLIISLWSFQSNSSNFFLLQVIGRCFFT